MRFATIRHRLGWQLATLKWPRFPFRLGSCTTSPLSALAHAEQQLQLRLRRAPSFAIRLPTVRRNEWLIVLGIDSVTSTLANQEAGNGWQVCQNWGNIGRLKNVANRSRPRKIQKKIAPVMNALFNACRNKKIRSLTDRRPNKKKGWEEPWSTWNRQKRKG